MTKGQGKSGRSGLNDDGGHRPTLPFGMGAGLGWAAALVWGSVLYASPITPVQLQAGSALKLEGSAPMHGFKSLASKLSLDMHVDGSAGSVKDLERLLNAGKVRDLKLEIPVFGLRSENRDLDDNLYRAMRAKEFPVVRFTMIRCTVAAGAKPTSTVKLSGELSLCGKTRTVEIDATMETVDKEIWVSGKKEVLMTDYGIEPPSMMMGMVKTDNRIMISFDLILGMKSVEEEPLLEGARREVK